MTAGRLIANGRAIADRGRREAQSGEHAAAGRIGEREGEVEAVRLLHVLN